MGSNVTRYDGGFARDWHEAIDLYKDFAPDHPDVIAGKPLHVPNVRIDDAPALNATVDAWRDESLRMGAAILRGIALGLGLEDDFFAGERAGDPFWVMRVIHYPPLPGGERGEAGEAGETGGGCGGGGGGGGGEVAGNTTAVGKTSELDAPNAAVVAAARGGAHLPLSVPLSCGEHTDYGLLTIVNQDDHVTALQVQNAAGQWWGPAPVQNQNPVDP
jgi:isopenicillin N synthase-like dioxygenase